MAASNTCLKCGQSLAEESRQGFCPKCLFLQASTGLFEPDLFCKDGFRGPLSEIPCQFGEYELLEEIGRGGMGVVYRARQRSLDRIVAIKTMAFGPAASPEFIKRFRAEAVSAASLHHPNIVAIYEVGIQEGRHFFVMDCIEGQSLARLAGSQPLPARRAASCLKTIADAVHYAHERGILHRDLKPSNVLIDLGGQPHVVDFGLARRLEGESELTLTGQVLGSPNYLPPEQAAGERARVSRRTDVYALGATLYHLLTGRPPFQAESLAQTLDLVLHAEPVSPRLLNPAVPRDLETICLKCLEKEPSRRYPTAQALAGELERFLAKKPIRARPLGPVGRLGRWCRRQPQLATLSAAAILALILGFAGVVWQWRRAESQRARAEAGEELARQRGYVSDMNLAQQALAANNLGRALELLDRHRPSVATPDLAGAARGSSSSGPGRLKAKLPTDLRCWEWRYLWQQCLSDAELEIGGLPGAIRSLEASSDGRFLAAGSEFGSVKVWDLSTHQSFPLAPEGGVQSFLAFSPDANLLAFTGQSLDRPGTIDLWDTRVRQQSVLVAQPDYVGPIGFSPDGRWFYYGVVLPDASKRIMVLDFATRRRVAEWISLTPIAGAHAGYGIAFRTNSQQLIVPESDGRIGPWNFIGQSEPGFFNAHTNGVTAIAVSSDDRILATAAAYPETVIKLWDLPSFRPLGVLTNHQDWITDLRFSPDGQTLASSSADQTIRLWNPVTMAESGVLRGHRHEVWRICFSADGRKLFSGARDGSVYRWPARVPPGKGCFEATPTDLSDVTLAPNAAHFAGIREGGVRFGNTRSGQLSGPVISLDTNNTTLLFSPDDQHLFAGTRSGEIRVWSLGEERVIRTLRGPAEPVRQLRQDALGRFLFAVYRPIRLLQDGRCQLQVWNTITWQPQASWTQPRLPIACALSPDGRRVATGHLPGVVLVWDFKAGLQTNSLDFVGRISDLAFSPDGRFLAASTQEGSVKIWDAPTLRGRMVIRAHSLPVGSLSFSPDSRRLATGSEGDEAIRLWDVATWQPLITLGKKGAAISQAAFTPDGNEIAAVNGRWPSEILRWRVSSPAEIEVNEKQVQAQ